MEQRNYGHSRLFNDGYNYRHRELLPRFGELKDQATNFLHSLKLQFAPPKINDPDFGPLLYMYISNHPERSYWECEWLFPKTETDISISLPGDESGPTKEARIFYL